MAFLKVYRSNHFGNCLEEPDYIPIDSITLFYREYDKNEERWWCDAHKKSYMIDKECDNIVEQLVALSEPTGH